MTATANAQRAGSAHARAIALISTGLLCVQMATMASAAEPTMTDQGVVDAIDNEFLFDRAVPSNEIDVSIADGVVTLIGEVNSLLAKERATRIAETVKGVRSVINRIAVVPSAERSDAAVERDVRSALLSDPATDSYEVHASVKGGIVTLTGTVQSWTEKQLCGTVAKGVKGVTGLKNRIKVKSKAQRADVEIAPEIEKALRWDVLVDDGLIDVKVKNGAVALTGTVGSAAEKRRARYDAWVAGVKSVDDSGLKVERWARDEDLRKDKYVAKPEKEVEEALKDALLYDPRVLSFNVTPDVAGSTVTLRGVVDSLKAKRAAEQVARNTVGVTYVTNRLKVRPIDGLSDAEIAQNIRDALLRDPYVERYEIGVNVIGGVAYLSGTVDSYFEKWQADDVASKINGVVSVRNNVDVEYAGPLPYDPYVDEYYPYDYEWYDYEPYHTFKTDAEIKDDIEDELWWSPYVDEDEVTVTVDDGVATLTGTVDSWSERGAARDNAYEGGAVWVDNELNVK
jgi:osmotically-inducible protein OsmY